MDKAIIPSNENDQILEGNDTGIKFVDIEKNCINITVDNITTFVNNENHIPQYARSDESSTATFFSLKPFILLFSPLKTSPALKFGLTVFLRIALMTIFLS
jgi:hypothetical protein